MNYILIVSVYVILLIGFIYSHKIKSTFQTKTNWWNNGFSIFAVNFSISTPLLLSGIYHKEGIGGLWIFWSSFLVSGFLPFVFAPLWSKLKFVTDNQFILFRFSGFSSRVLHKFRAIYVGLFVVAFLISFQILSLLKVIVFYIEWDRDISFIVVSFFLILITFRNQLYVIIKLDKLHIIFILSVFIAALLVLGYNGGGHNESIEYLNKTSPNLLNIFPKNKIYLLVLFLVQTWSVVLFDGSGIDAQRYFSQKNKKEIWKVAVLNTVLQFVFTIILVLILVYGSSQFPDFKSNDKEIYILHYLKTSFGYLSSPLIFIAFLACFITSFLGLLNWGTSFLTIDIFKTYVNNKASDKKTRYIGVLNSLFIVFLSLIFAYYSDTLEGLLKLLFSITAGVSPVFVLRWFWFRINAWSQISAMLGSGFFTILCMNSEKIYNLKIYFEKHYNLNDYSFQLIFVTITTSILWICVTYLTPKDDEIVLKRFRETVFVSFNLKRNFLKAIIFGFCIVMIFTTILYFLFT